MNFPFNFNINNVPSDDDDNNRRLEELLALLEDRIDLAFEPNPEQEVPHDINFDQNELNEDPVNLELYAENYAAFEDNDDMNMEQGHVPHALHNFPEDEDEDFHEDDFEFEMNLGINGFFHAPFLDEPMDPDQGVQIVPDLDMSRVDNSGQNPRTVPADPQQFVEDIHEGLWWGNRTIF